MIFNPLLAEWTSSFPFVIFSFPKSRCSSTESDTFWMSSWERQLLFSCVSVTVCRVYSRTRVIRHLVKTDTLFYSSEVFFFRIHLATSDVSLRSLVDVGWPEFHWILLYTIMETAFEFPKFSKPLTYRVLQITATGPTTREKNADTKILGCLKVKCKIHWSKRILEGHFYLCLKHPQIQSHRPDCNVVRKPSNVDCCGYIWLDIIHLMRKTLQYVKKEVKWCSDHW